ncbi:hypothetical protein EVAR_69799_1 [Eumeta japonica]|uniref:Uncharacterized protein n=1 Tax=Eumeta variegata TaxID=151549 RepID=A0A4C1SEW5_EUMVA|nr:hypothetical protein EVAR_69799_1 [Eumeta japonica]
MLHTTYAAVVILLGLILTTSAMTCELSNSTKSKELLRASEDTTNSSVTDPVMMLMTRVVGSARPAPDCLGQPLALIGISRLG